MKIKQVEQILKSEKTIIIYEGPNCQWLGTRSAIYPAYNLPLLDEKSLFAMFDIPQDDKSKYYFQEDGVLGRIHLNDVDPDEKIIKCRDMFWIYSNGRTLEPLKTSKGILFIDCQYLKPFTADKSSIELYERTTSSGATYIAVKSGFMLAGIIYPYNPINEGFVEQCEQLYRLSKNELYKIEWEEQKEE